MCGRGRVQVALIAGRTADNPALLREVIDKGATCVYLEKPGAPTVRPLAIHCCFETAPINPSAVVGSQGGRAREHGSLRQGKGSARVHGVQQERYQVSTAPHLCSRGPAS